MELFLPVRHRTAPSLRLPLELPLELLERRGPLRALLQPAEHPLQGGRVAPLGRPCGRIQVSPLSEQVDQPPCLWRLEQPAQFGRLAQQVCPLRRTGRAGAGVG